MNKDNVLILILFVALFTGLGSNIMPQKIKVLKDDNQSLSSELKQVKEEFSKIESKEDKILIYKLFSGAGDYLQNAEKLSSTPQFDPVLGRVQTSYGWNREKYKSFTDSVSNYLKSVDYQTPKKLESKTDRENFSKIFKSLAEVTKYE